MPRAMQVLRSPCDDQRSATYRQDVDLFAEAKRRDDGGYFNVAGPNDRTRPTRSTAPQSRTRPPTVRPRLRRAPSGAEGCGRRRSTARPRDDSADPR
jgi:hypothetical protein